VHQFFVGGDWKLRPGLSANLGTGFDLAGTNRSPLLGALRVDIECQGYLFVAAGCPLKQKY
jgi:hypothetical protein